MSDITVVSSDTAPSIFGTLSDTNGAINLTGASVKFQMRPATDRRFTVDAAATIVTPLTGSVRYDWAAGDLATPGDYVMRWQVTLIGGAVQHTDPENTITVGVR